jgi:hypothetical protein
MDTVSPSPDHEAPASLMLARVRVVGRRCWAGVGYFAHGSGLSF